MGNWVTQNWSLVGIIALYLIGYMILKYFLKTFLINRSKKRNSQ